MSKTESKSTAKNLVAGGTAGAIECIIMFPTEYVKTQLQLFPQKYTKGPINCAVTVVKERGFFSLYRGLSSLIVGSIPKAAVRFAAFNAFSQLLADETGKLPGYKTMLAGLGAGISEAIIAVTPMETIKTMFIHDQSQPKPKYRGLVHGVSTIIKEEGIRGIYKGIVPTCMKQGGNQATRFFVYTTIKDMIRGDTKKDLEAWQALLCGAVAGATSVYATMPFDVIKTKMQGLQSKQYSGTLDCLRKTVKADGILGLWKGTTPRLGRVCFSSSIIFASYEQVMRVLNVFWKEPQ